MTGPRRIVVLAGRGRYEDPWHDHAATSHALATLLGEVTVAGGKPHVEVRSVFRHVLEDLDTVDLLVVNSGRGRIDPEFDGADDDWRAFHARVEEWARAGGRILGIHQAANTFLDAPGWEEVVGGRWIEGTSMHPEISEATFRLEPGHVITDGLPAVEAFDERYCFLRVAPGAQVLGSVEGPAAVPDDDGSAASGTTSHPVLWVQEAHGGRTVYSALGHDLRSYASPTHQELLRRAVAWLLG
ncbi:ThuA domain-containing protein [Antribacter gilvus]|uniref:ThuA domain-containing protein n=1 Tax=Antribacter gilvus TaxID=2304675 RepID=UPI000F786B5C|nr:ThuA domain-containing protein [Antribacter gilvus]